MRGAVFAEVLLLQVLNMTLEDFFARHPRTALGFSGGTDSAYLLYAGLSLGADVRPYYIKTQFQPEFELADASRLRGSSAWSSSS